MILLGIFFLNQIIYWEIGKPHNFFYHSLKKTELGIRTMDSIAFSKTFVFLPNEDKIHMLKEFISDKTGVALQ